MASAQKYIPRTDLGFPDRRRSERLDLSFTDEAEAEQWERENRSDRVDFRAESALDRGSLR